MPTSPLTRREALGAIAASAVLGVVSARGEDAPETPASQPTTQPAGGSLRKPEQVEILQNLLNERDQTKPVQPQATAGSKPQEPELDPDGNPLERDGSMLIERPGRLMLDGQKPRFVYNQPGLEKPRELEMLPNQLLELLEKEAAAGFTEFTVSAEVTRYRGRNYLLLRKILRHIGHGNLSP